jgi:hypothetical protein
MHVSAPRQSLQDLERLGGAIQRQEQMIVMVRRNSIASDSGIGQRVRNRSR